MEDYSIQDLLQILKKRLTLILTITSIAVSLVGLYTFFYVTPMYQSSTKLLINQTIDGQTTVDSTDIQVQSNLQLIDTYNQIIKSNTILGKVAEKLGTGVTVGQLNEQISIQKSENSQVITILVKDASAEQAAKIADTTAEVFQTQIVKIMKVDNVSILDKAIINPAPVEPNPTLNISIGLLIGLMAGVGTAFLLDYLDNTLKSEQDIENILEAPVLGSIAIIDEIKMDKIKKRKITGKSDVRGESLGSWEK